MTDTYDQTQFVIEEPLFEKTSPQSIQKAEQQSNQQNSPSSKKKWLLVILAGIGVLLLSLIVAAALMRDNAMPIFDETTPEETSSINNDPYKQQLDELEDQLEAADPTLDELPFPQVDMEIGLE